MGTSNLVTGRRDKDKDDKSGEKVDKRFPNSRVTIETRKREIFQFKRNVRSIVYKQMEELLLEVVKKLEQF